MIIPCVDINNPVESARINNHTGADAVGYYEEKVSIETVKSIKEVLDAPLYVGGGIKDLEDVKKVLYAGADKICLGKAVLEDKDIVKKASKRFGTDSVMVSMNLDTYSDCAEFAKEMERLGAGCLLVTAKDSQKVAELMEETSLPVIVCSQGASSVATTLKETKPFGVAFSNDGDTSIVELKKELKADGIDVQFLESSISFDQFTLNSDGMLPVVTQDYMTGEVLMVAYMTEESFNQTLETGIMTYYSRSRDELWVKGDTSGHFQYVKSLAIDCDKDTLLAKVRQVGSACHTGNRSCFYTELAKKEYKDENPMTVFQDVYDVIADRKVNPKEGSYTNYLFNEGIDKILKKVGEECTEIVIAAKNPDPEEMKYEISDFLYHLMVLMAERGMTWKQVTDELMERK